MPPASEFEALLSEDRWIRALAARLVRDPGAADDLVQETYLTALSSGARPHSARAWLRGVLRNLWRDGARSGARRERRERTAARGELVPSSSDLAAEVELRKRVAEAVLALEEPLRRTVVLRFFRDLSLPAIAAAEGVSVSTVHERVQRALAKLRVELDAAHGGKREAWAATLLTLARPASTGAGALEVAAMASGWKVAAAAVCLAGGLAWWWNRGEPAPVNANLGAPAAFAEPAASVAGARLAAPTAPTSALREAQPAEAPPGQQALESTPPLLTGRVIDTAGNGIGAVEVELASAAGDPPRATTELDGSFALACEDGDRFREIRCLDARYTTLVAGQGIFDDVHIVIVSPALSFAGLVVDASAAPIAGAELAFVLRPSLFRVLEMQLPRAAETPGWRTQSDVSGHFALADLAGGEHLALRVRAVGFRERLFDLPAVADSGLVIALEREQDALALDGLVLGPDGRPFAGAKVSAGQELVRSDADGRFRLALPAGAGRWERAENDDWHWQEGDGARLIALAPQHLPALVEFTRDAPPQPLVLQLGAAPLAVAGRVVDAQGEPRASVVLWPRALTPFGNVPPGEPEDGAHTVEEELCGQESGWFGALTAADGTFELGCLPEGALTLELFDSRTAAQRSELVTAGDLDLELVLADEPGTTRVAGRVVYGDGSPVVGAMVKPRRTQIWRDPPQLSGGQYWVDTDEQGRFEFPAMATHGTWLEVVGMQSSCSVALDSVTDLEHIEIVRPRLCELQLILASPSAADSFGVFDAAGTELDVIERIVNQSRHVAFTLGPRGALADGRSGVVQVPESARTLALFQGQTELVRVPLQVDPTQRTVLRP